MFCFFFFNDTATTEIYTLSLHDALPICEHGFERGRDYLVGTMIELPRACLQADLIALEADFFSFGTKDRKSTRLNSSHANISYAVFCLKKKKKQGSDDESC